MTDQTPVSVSTPTPPQPPVAPGAPSLAPEPPRFAGYDKFERVLVPVLAVIGYLFARWVMPANGGIGIAVVDWLTVAAAAWYIGATGKHTRASVIWLAIAAALGLPFALYAPSGLQFFVSLGVLTATACAVYAAGHGHTAFLRDHFTPEACGAVILYPFSRFGKYFCALGSMFHVKRRRPAVWWAVLGLAVSIPLTAIVCSLLLADSQFARVMGEITAWLRDNVLYELLQILVRMIFIIPAALYLFGMLYAARRPSVAFVTAEERDDAAARRRRVPQALVYAMTVPMLVIYTVFICAQIPYFFAAFANVVPEGLTYAEYARTGFFELCVVAAINLGVLLFMEALCRRREDGVRPLGHRIVTVALSAVSLVLLATSLRKQFLYIEAYGLSRLRVYAAWLCVLLAVVFVILIVCQFVKKARPAKPIMLTAVVCALVLLLGNPDWLIAEYNVAAYERGAVEEMDVEYLEELSDAAVPAIVRLTASEDADVAARAQRVLEDIRIRRNDNDAPWYAWNVQDWCVDQLLKK